MLQSAIPRFTVLILSVALAFGAADPSRSSGAKKDRLAQTRPSTTQAASTQPWPSDEAPPAPPLSPDEALRSFKLEPGFRIDVVASEPLVEDPVAMAFDADGRLWVAEMRGYMPDVDAHREDQPNGRIVVLEDTHSSGHFDKRTVFMDGLYLPRAVMPVRDGVLVASPPFLWFCRDTDGDGKADEKIVLSDDYGRGRDPEYGSNTPLWGLDNWIYSAMSTTRFRWDEGKWKTAPMASRGQWGLAQDDYGRLFFNYNSDQLRADLIPSFYLDRNPHFRPAGGNVQLTKDQHVFPIRVNPGVNRGYEPNQLRPDRTLNTVTATCGPTIYRGDQFPPEFYGNSFICEPSGNLVHRHILTEKDGDLSAKAAYAHSEFLASTDERFRPVSLLNGPDGALYVVDMYRGVLQHKTYVTPWLRKQILDRKLEQPLHYGRIYRITYDLRKAPLQLRKAPRLSTAGGAELVHLLSHPNGWTRETTQRLLVERADRSVLPDLSRLLASGKTPLARLHSLWTLEGLHAINDELLRTALHDSDAHVAAAAIRIAGESDLLYRRSVFAEVLPLADDPRPEVRLQFALTVSAMDDTRAEAALAHLLATHADQPYLRDAAISGLADREFRFLSALLTDNQWQQETPARAAVLSTLAACVFRAGHPDPLAHLLDTLSGPRGWREDAILQSLATLAKTAPKKHDRVALSTPPALLTELASSKDKRQVEAARQIDTLLHWPGKPEPQDGSRAAPLTKDQKASFERGKAVYGVTCILCHQPNGQGQEGKAPPLKDSPWVLGASHRPVRIVLQGLRGPITVANITHNLEMPALGVLDDQQIADVITYVRREWGHEANPVTKEEVAKVRAEVGPRQAAWTEAELQKLP